MNQIHTAWLDHPDEKNTKTYDSKQHLNANLRRECEFMFLVQDEESACVHEVQGNKHIQISFKKVQNK